MSLYDGKNIQLSVGDDGIANLVFNAEGSVNKFDSQTVQELQQAVDQVTEEPAALAKQSLSTANQTTERRSPSLQDQSSEGDDGASTA